MADVSVTVKEEMEAVNQTVDAQRIVHESIKGGDQKDNRETTKPCDNPDVPNESAETDKTVPIKEAEKASPNEVILIASGECGTLLQGEKKAQLPANEKEDLSESAKKSPENISRVSDFVPNQMDSVSSIRLNEGLSSEQLKLQQLATQDLSQYCPEMPSCFEDANEISKELFVTARKLCDRQRQENNGETCPCTDEFEIDSDLSCYDIKSQTTDEELDSSLQRTSSEVIVDSTWNNENTTLNRDEKSNAVKSFDRGAQSKSTMTEPAHDNNESNAKQELKLVQAEHLARISKEIENAERMASVVVDKLKDSFHGITGSIINMTEDLGKAISDLIEEIVSNVSPFDDNLPQHTYELFDHLWHSLSREVEQLKLLAEYLNKSVDNSSEN